MHTNLEAERNVLAPIVVARQRARLVAVGERPFEVGEGTTA